MNSTDLKSLKVQFPTALTVWYDRMHDLNKGQLIETLLVHMSPAVLGAYLAMIDNEVAKERRRREETMG